MAANQTPSGKPKQAGRRFEPELVQRVAEALAAGRRLVAYHRDYCGLGLACEKGRYIYAEVWDGQLQGLNTQDDRPPFALVFPDQAEFVQWLGSQSDATLSRRELPDSFYWHNQTITRQRLRQFVAGS
ncbi:hypothetical protein [Hymenobacter cellulosivorans]|uniref:DUF2750 domain-containing protein n=1 Tax=Hymenobacter cellulosivorans TaxID=2932249 RepID=A0ABY4FGV1_9BACT|nr:hypothetical protein [Hymenobacter cellulosivorans]UOQ55248.1 hypothetical protein MUN80_10930 [Hymenobacter cellulosivorans]